MYSQQECKYSILFFILRYSHCLFYIVQITDLLDFLPEYRKEKVETFEEFKLV